MDESTTQTNAQKEIHTLILDTGPIILNATSPTTLLQKCESLITLPSVVAEIKDEASRTRFETLWRPFLTFRTPKPESIKYVSDFAKKTGDFSVMGTTDLQVLALAFEIDVERNGGVEGRERRLREGRERQEEKRRRRKERKQAERVVGGNTEGEDGNEVVEGTEQVEKSTEGNLDDEQGQQDGQVEDDGWTTVSKKMGPVKKTRRNKSKAAQTISTTKPEELDTFVSSNNLQSAPQTLEGQSSSTEETTESITESIQDITLQDAQPTDIPELDPEITTASSDEDDWITPDNLPQKILEDSGTTLTNQPTSTLQIPCACATTDFAMQNVLLQLNIHLFSPTTCHRITSTKSHVLRCHGCFKISRDLTKQFCPNCGAPNLTRATCTTNAAGEFKIHLAKNWQWNNRGNVYSMSKPEHGTASGKGVKERLILTEDQKEYQVARKEAKKVKEKDLMDRDYVPGLLTGERLGHGGNVKIGPGRDVNAKRGPVQRVRQT